MGPMARAFRSFTHWCRRKMQRLLRRNYRRTAVELVQANSGKESQLPTELEQQLQAVDWSCRDTLVGSFRAPEQFYDNLNRNYYYIPAGFLEGDPSEIRYIALYQSQRFFGNDAGISYYGKVTRAQRVKREEIGFPGNPYASDEPYVLFAVDCWLSLETPISIRDEGVYAPRKTHFFLLQNCTRSYELFHIRTEADYRLMVAIGKALEDRTADKKKRTLYPVDGNFFVAVIGKHILLTDAGGNILDRRNADSFARSPRSGFYGFKKCLQTK